MTLDQLKTQAVAILAIKAAPGYAHKTFTTRSGGHIRNPLNIPEVARETTLKYKTVRHGGAYAGSLVIECRDTGAQDANGDTIYETPSGEVFVYAYRGGSAESFDHGRLAEPDMRPVQD